MTNDPSSSAPKQFRKKPVVIDAVQWTNDGDGGSLKAILALARNGRVTFAADGTADLILETLEGDMRANVGDWIIRGVKQEIYPCKPDIFGATYEAVTDSDDPAELRFHLRVGERNLSELQGGVLHAIRTWTPATPESY